MLSFLSGFGSCFRAPYQELERLRAECKEFFRIMEKDYRDEA